ncbi:MAG: hypothetical protein ACHQ6T_17975 [Myxococcota bacterium]
MGASVAYTWGTTPEERARAFPCDTLLPSASQAYWRGVTVEATPARVFRWLCQLRAGPYSYDWIDNLGRRSPQTLTPGLESLSVGQRVMIFDLASFERDVHLTLRLRRSGVFPALAISYLVVPLSPGEVRLLAKLVLVVGSGLFDRVRAELLAWGDLVMMRRQLLNLKRLAETSG